MGTAEEVTTVIKYSPKRENILGSIKEQIERENDSDFHANSLWHRCFPVNFVKFLRAPSLHNTSGQLLLNMEPDENRVKFMHNRSQNTNGIFSSVFWSQSWSQNFFPNR